MAATKSFEKIQARMASETAAMTIEGLCDALLWLEAMTTGRRMDNAEHMVQAHISDEICRRCPKAEAAAEHWTENPDMWDLPFTEVIVAAAFAAADR